MNRLAWRSVRSHPAQFFLSILVIVLGVAFAVAGLCLRQGAESSYEGLVDSVSTADVYILPEGATVVDPYLDVDQKGSVPDTVITSIVGLPDVAGANPLYSGPVTLMGADGLPVSEGRLPSRAVSSDLYGIEGHEITAGELPADETQIALEKSTAEKAGLTVGSKTSIIGSGRTIVVTVSGIVDYGPGMGNSVIVILDRMLAKVLYCPMGLVPSISVQKSDLSTAEAVADAVKEVLSSEGQNVNVLLGSQARDDAQSAPNETLRLVSIILLIAAGAALVCGGCLVGNIFGTLQRYRTKENAIVRTLGASPGQVTRAALFQGLIIGVIGSVIGVSVGYGLSVGLKPILARFDVVHLVGSMLPSVVTLAACFVLGVVVCMVAALVCALRAAHISPLSALHPGQKAPESGSWANWVFGLLFFVAGLAVLYFSIMGTQPMWTLGTGIVAVLIGALILGPVVMPPVVTVLDVPLRVVARVTGKLAKEDVIRDRRHAANAAGVLVVGMALVTGGSILVSSYNQSVADVMNQEITSVYVIHPSRQGDVVPQTVIDAVRQLPLTQVYAFGDASVKVSISDQDMKDVKVMYAPDSAFTNGIEPTIVDGMPANFSTGIAVSQSFSQKFGVSVGDVMTVTLAPGSAYETQETLPVALVIGSHLLGDVTLPSGWLQSYMPAQVRSTAIQPTVVLVNPSDPGQADSLRTEMDTIVEDASALTIDTKDAYIASVDHGAGLYRLGVYILLGITVFFAWLLIAGTLNRFVYDRQRDLGVAKGLGLRNGQISRMFTMESVLIALYGTIAGMVIGAGLAFVARKVLSGYGLTTIHFPWLKLAALLVVAIVVGILAALTAAHRAAKTPVPQAVSYV